MKQYVYSTSKDYVLGFVARYAVNTYKPISGISIRYYYTCIYIYFTKPELFVGNTSSTIIHGCSCAVWRLNSVFENCLQSFHCNFFSTFLLRTKIFNLRNMKICHAPTNMHHLWICHPPTNMHHLWMSPTHKYAPSLDMSPTHKYAPSLDMNISQKFSFTNRNIFTDFLKKLQLSVLCF